MIHPRTPTDSDDRPALRRRVPRRARHRPRGDGRSEPGARAARRQHGFLVEELHPPFDTRGADALGPPAPGRDTRARRSAPTRCSSPATGPRRSTGVRAALDLCATVTRVLDETGEATIFAPLGRGRADWTVERAFAAAKARSGRLASVGVDADWSGLVDRHAERHAGVEIEHLTLDRGAPPARGRPGRRGRRGGRARATRSRRPAAQRRRGGSSPPASSRRPGRASSPRPTATASDIAGQGVADPSPMLLAAALLLARGSRPRRGCRGARGEPHARRSARPRRPSDVAGPGVAATTREFVDTVLGLLPSARRDTEFALGVGR